MYVTREDFRRRMFEGQIRAIWECRLITFVWGTHNPKESMWMKPDPEWEKLGPKYDVQFFGPAFNGPGAGGGMTL
jgi:hypothetical protein